MTSALDMNTTKLRVLRKRVSTRLFGKLARVVGAVILIYVALQQSQIYYLLAREIGEELPAIKNTNTCVLPRYNPFDPSIQNYIKSWKEIDCGKPQLPLTFLDAEGLLHINRKTKAGKDIYCYFHEIIREEDDDYLISLGPPKVIFDPERLPYEYTIVKCEDARTAKVIYETGYSNIVDVAKNVATKSKAASASGRVNVLILVFDSMSRLNFVRQLPKTNRFIKRVKGTVMNGLTKVGDNTHPNMLALLSGFTAKRYSDQKALDPFWSDDSGYFDDLPALWKNFSQNGYVTMFTEDHPTYAAFNYMLNGFKMPPTDYYTRPFWLAMEELNQSLSKDHRCYGHLPKHEFLFNYTKEFVAKMQKEGNAFFSLMFSTLLSHDHINSIKIIDEDLLALLEALQAQKVFENSVVLVMGDHGNRFDPIRRTAIGRVEERMPYLAVMLPPSLERFRSSLQANADVLTSWHDVREMLLDLAVDNLGLESKVMRHGLKGLSLLRPIPSERTCLEIGIPREYCVCWTERELSPRSSRLKKTAQTFLVLLNELLDRHDKRRKCARLVLDKVHSGQLLLPTPAVGLTNGLTEVSRVLISVFPSNALLEGSLETDDNGTRIMGNVNRVNSYGSQSDCVNNAALTLICYCKEQDSLLKNFISALSVH